MGIKHLRMLLNTMCTNKGVYHFSTVDNFIMREKAKMYGEISRTVSLNNPLRQLQLKTSIKNKPYPIGIDVYLYASRYKRVFKKIEFGFFRQIMLSLSSKMIPLYIFDGVAPVSKRKTITQRQNKKQKNRDRLEKLLEERKSMQTNSSSIDGYYSENNMENLNFDQLVKHINQLKDKLMDNVSPASAEKEYLISILLDDNNEYNDTWDNVNDGSSYLLYDNNDTDQNKELIRLAKKSSSIEHDDIKNLKIFLTF